MHCRISLRIYQTSQLGGEQSQLLVSFVKPHKAVTKDTVARWVKSILQKLGIDTVKFTSQSTRATSTSCVKAAGVNLQQITKSADWSNSVTFAKFYDKHIGGDNFGSTVQNIGNID